MCHFLEKGEPPRLLHPVFLPLYFFSGCNAKVSSFFNHGTNYKPWTRSLGNCISSSIVCKSWNWLTRRRRRTTISPFFLARACFWIGLTKGIEWVFCQQAWVNRAATLTQGCQPSLSQCGLTRRGSHDAQAEPHKIQAPGSSRSSCWLYTVQQI